MRTRTPQPIFLLLCAGIVCACGGSAELGPEIAAHLDEYQQLIDEFEPKFDQVRNDPPKFAEVAESYRQRAQAWVEEWATVAPDLSDADGKAIQTAVAKLNRRAEKMLTGA